MAHLLLLPIPTLPTLFYLVLNVKTFLLQQIQMQNFICHQNQQLRQSHTSTRHQSQGLETNNSISTRHSMRAAKVVATLRMQEGQIKFRREKTMLQMKVLDSFLVNQRFSCDFKQKTFLLISTTHFYVNFSSSTLNGSLAIKFSQVQRGKKTN